MASNWLDSSRRTGYDVGLDVVADTPNGHPEGWNFKQISDWLVENNYKTPRGKVFTQPHVWSIYKKKIKSITRFSREFDHVITDMKVDSLN